MSAADDRAVTLNGVTYRWPRCPVVVVCIDGGDPAYFDQAGRDGIIPNVERFMAQGFGAVADGIVPSLTNPNNLSIVTGSPSSGSRHLRKLLPGPGHGRCGDDERPRFRALRIALGGVLAARGAGGGHHRQRQAAPAAGPEHQPRWRQHQLFVGAGRSMHARGERYRASARLGRLAAGRCLLGRAIALCARSRHQAAGAIPSRADVSVVDRLHPAQVRPRHAGDQRFLRAAGRCVRTAGGARSRRRHHRRSRHER